MLFEPVSISAGVKPAYDFEDGTYVLYYVTNFIIKVFVFNSNGLVATKEVPNGYEYVGNGGYVSISDDVIIIHGGDKVSAYNINLEPLF